MLILENKISFIERYNRILKKTLRPKIIYLDERLIWKRFRKIFGLYHQKLKYLKNNPPEILENLSDDEIYRSILKSCGSIIEEIL